MTTRYTNLGGLSTEDVGKNISIGNADTGIVTGVLRGLFVETEFIYEKTMFSTKAQKIPTGFLYYVAVSDWRSEPLALDTKVTIED